MREEGYMGRMDMNSRNQYLKVLIERYLKATKKGKGLLPYEYCRNTGLNRKYVIRKIRRIAFKEPLPQKKRRAFYGSDVRDILQKLWELFDYPCGQRLKPLLKVEVDRLRDIGEIKVSETLSDKLKSISSATIDRLLKAKKEAWRYERRHKHTGGSLLYKKIPLRLTDWDTNKVGYVEIDLVCHCGASSAGEHINSLSTIEISSGWWEAEAIMGRGQHRTFEALEGPP